MNTKSNVRYLIKQYQDANLIDDIDLESDEFISSFASWLSNMKTTGLCYTNFLDSLGFSFNNRKSAEIGKCKYDAVTEPYETRIFTNTPQEFSHIDCDRIIRGELTVCDSMPFLMNEDRFIKIPNNIISTYMTQNSYFDSYVYGLDELHNSGDYNIIVGAFGDLNDFDRKRKLKMLKDFKKLLNDDVLESYNTSHGYYYYAVGTDPKAKNRIRNK